MKTKRMAYFDFVFEAREKGDAWVSAFEDFAHWGYWEDPARASGTLDELKPSMARLNQVMIDATALRDGMTLVDVGCGFGGTLRTVNEQRRNMRLFGVDPDDRLIGSARESVKGLHGNDVQFFEAFAESLPFEDNSVDRMLAIECIFCFPSRAAFLKEAFRVLKPGGTLVVSDFLVGRSPRMLRRQKAQLDQMLFKWLGSTSIITDPEYHVLSRDAGFERLWTRDITANTLPTYPSRVAMFRSTGLPTRFLMPRILTVKAIELATRLGFLKYVILRFEKGGSASA